MNRASWQMAVEAITADADQLRAAGVLRIRVGEVEFDLAPAEREYESDPVWSEPEPVGMPQDPTADPALFPGGMVPAFRRED